MALEDLTGSNKFIANLVPANPPATDPASQGSDHIQGIKNVLQNTFPGMAGAYAFGPTANPMTWTVGSAERMRIEAANGQITFTSNSMPIAIFKSTTNPATIHIKSSDNTLITSIGKSTNDNSLVIDASAPSANIEFLSQGTSRGRFHPVNGFMSALLSGTGVRNVSCTPGGYLQADASDERLKEQVKGLPYGLEQVSAMRPVSFHWKDTEKRGEQREIGFIAQEMQKLVPEIVGTNYDDMLSLNYQMLVPVLVKAIQELKAEVDALKAR